MFLKSLIHTATVISAVYFLTAISGCKNPIVKDTSLVNGANDLLNMTTVDTFTVRSKTVLEYPYQSSGVSYALLGSMDDAIFGKTVCGFYAQCQLSSDGYNFGTNAVLDSCVLSLSYSSKYGANTQSINIAVYELTTSLDNSAIYKTNAAFAVNGNPLGIAYNIVPNYTDSLSIQGEMFGPQMRIPLNSIGQRILSADSSTLSGNSNFLQFFKGIYVTPQGNYGNGVSIIDLLNSKITVYYHNNIDDSLHFDIPISSSSARVNHFEHQNSVTLQQALNSTNVSDSIVYVQSGAGVRVKLTIPALDSLPTDIAINKAELIISVLQGDTTYAVPSTLTMVKINASDSLELLDQIYDGGKAVSQTQTINGNTYTQYIFSLNNYMQTIVSKQYPNKGLSLTLASGSSASRVILANYPNSDENLKIKLKLIYTKLQ